MVLVSRVPEGVPTGGRFTSRSRTDAVVVLIPEVVGIPGGVDAGSVSDGLPPVKQVHVSGRWGGSDVTPGVVDGDAIGAFMGGQCVAFAAEYADHLGTDVTYIYNRVRRQVLHAYVVHPTTKKAIDIRGARDEHNLQEEYLQTKVREHIDIVTVTPAEARKIKKSVYGENMFKPASKAAATFVRAVDEAILADPLNVGTEAAHRKFMNARAAWVSQAD